MQWRAESADISRIDAVNRRYASRRHTPSGELIQIAGVFLRNSLTTNESTFFMTTSITFPLGRREFLAAVIGAPLALSKEWHNELPWSPDTAERLGNTSQRNNLAEPADPSIKNFNNHGRPEIVEGTTLLVLIRFTEESGDVMGSLPVKVQSDTVGHRELDEPQPIFLYPSAGAGKYYTIIAAPLNVVPRTYYLNLDGASMHGTTSRWRFPYTFNRGVYRHTDLTLSKNFTSPTPEIKASMLHDFETMVDIYHRRSPRYWKLPFLLPTSGPAKNNFGDRRTVNGTKIYSHSGLDFHAPIGTPVRAVNDGVVAFSGEQWTPGQTVCIDHGGSVFSKYQHLSERRVSEGDRISRGQLIGLSGHSGGQRPAPHLHLDLVVNGIHVDPIAFMRTAAIFIDQEKLDGQGR